MHCLVQHTIDLCGRVRRPRFFSCSIDWVAVPWLLHPKVAHLDLSSRTEKQTVVGLSRIRELQVFSNTPRTNFVIHNLTTVEVAAAAISDNNSDVLINKITLIYASNHDATKPKKRRRQLFDAPFVPRYRTQWEQPDVATVTAAWEHTNKVVTSIL